MARRQVCLGIATCRWLRSVFAGIAGRLPSAGARLFQTEYRMHRLQCLDAIGPIHEHGNLDVAGRDHFHIHPLGGEGGEHFLGDPRVRAHAAADDGHLAHILDRADQAAEFGHERLQGGDRRVQIIAQDRETDRRPAIVANALADHIDRDVLARDRRENPMAHARPIGHILQEQAYFVLGQCGTGDRKTHHPFRFGHDPRALGVREAAAHHQGHIVLLGEFDRT